jgi:hypothetical protein
MEQWVIDSNTPYKFIEVVNTDDIVNVQYMFGGKEGIEDSIKSGTSAFVSWMADKHFDLLNNKGMNMVQKALRVMQLYPELSYTTFLNGASSSQSNNIPDDKKLAFRLGQRKAEVKIWGSHVLNRMYNRTLNVLFCKRRIEWNNEFFGKSHTSYADTNMNLFWSPVRAYEDSLYRYYAEHTLKVNNKLRIVGLFSSVDKQFAEKLIQKYNVPLWKPGKNLMKSLHTRSIQKP